MYFTTEKNCHNGFVAVGTVQIHIGTADSEKSDEQRKNHGCLGYIEDFTTQVYRDYDKPLYGFLSNN